ncbi:recombinase [Clostridium baratii]|uniref:ERF family protein n=1 Tax=Clostridium baratii TaxID=1561 RepID=UPI0009A3C0E1|nr:ERF family protein [Clostridium baratii]OPF51525.1 recombinase [Clostridium baratii]OPF55404.1 recombinase [Clostridium baratii]OPF57687.1 recombinase [Clostridium baratii]OPF60215.1 recombinase [Clostridium baratii]
MAEEKKLNIYQKIQKARVELQNKKLKKSGKNTYSNYEYFELGDFLPGVNDVCNNNGLSTIFHFEKDKASLKVIDVDEPTSCILFETPIEMAAIKGSSVMQQIGGTQTYARRYLYMMAFEIAESDVIDGGEIDTEAEERRKKINKSSVLTINKLIDETETDKKKFLVWAGVNKVEDITNEALGTCLQMLDKKKNDIALKKQQEEHQKELEQHQTDFEF